MDPLLIIVIVALVLWAGGVTLSVGGTGVHLLLALVMVVVLIRLLQTRPR